MSYEEILTEVQCRVGIITMNRPDKLNAMNARMDYEIRDQIADWNADESIGAIIWTGAGRGFCAGADISRFEASVQGENLDNVVPRPAQSWIDMIKTAKPVIAAINGVSIGEGLTRTLPCDVRVASDTPPVLQIPASGPNARGRLDALRRLSHRSRTNPGTDANRGIAPSG